MPGLNVENFPAIVLKFSYCFTLRLAGMSLRTERKSTFSAQTVNNSRAAIRILYKKNTPCCFIIVEKCAGGSFGRPWSIYQRRKRVFLFITAIASSASRQELFPDQQSSFSFPLSINVTKPRTTIHYSFLSTGLVASPLFLTHRMPIGAAASFFHENRAWPSHPLHVIPREYPFPAKSTNKKIEIRSFLCNVDNLNDRAPKIRTLIQAC